MCRQCENESERMTEESSESNHMFPRPTYYKTQSSPAGMGVALSGGSDISEKHLKPAAGT